VIRGERARFQLFGDSVNTTSRIESTGRPDQIHLSEQTAKELKRLGKGKWCVPRKDKVVAKGKGELETYWLLLDSGRVCDNTQIVDDGIECTPDSDEPRRSHSNASSNLVDWNTEVLVQLLSKVVECRPMVKFAKHNEEMTAQALTMLGRSLGASSNIVGEIADVIAMPKWSGNTKETSRRLSQESIGHIRAFVERIASLYNNVPCKSSQVLKS
jgi:Adenylate and Guanylate cyclase catalytic domain